MQFDQAQKLATYAMLAAGFLGLAGGGGMPLWATALGGGGLLATWFLTPETSPIGTRASRWWSAAALVVVTYALFFAFTSGQYVAAGGIVLLFLAIAKASTRASARDWQQLCTLAFLMLIAGSVLNVDVTYGLAFFSFVIATTWALSLLHLRSEIETRVTPTQIPQLLGSRRIVDRQYFVITGMLSFAVFLVATAAFVFIPRIGLGAFVRSRQANQISGFSEGVQLGGHGRIKTDARVVMRVKLRNGPPTNELGSIHWRGIAFDEYSAGSWQRSVRAPLSDFDTRPRSGSLLRRAMDPPRDAMHQEIWLEPLDTDILFGAARAVQFLAPIQRVNNGAVERNGDVRHRHASALRYEVWSLPEFGAATLRDAAQLEPGTPYDVYLQLPASITDRTRALAIELTREQKNNFDKAKAIETYLRQNYKYSLDMVDPGPMEPVDFFLFERRAGHCEYFASAFAILARAAGIPTRNVNGFLGGEWNTFEKYIAVRAGDAHSWTEVYFPGVGWRTFDATPGGAAPTASGAFADLRRWFDTLQFQWTQWIVEYDLSAQMDVFRKVGAGLGGLKQALLTAFRVVRWPLLGLLILAAIYGARRFWQPERRLRAEVGAVDQAYRKAVRTLSAHGLSTRVGQTPKELADAWTARRGVAAEQLAALTELLYRTRFGSEQGLGAQAKQVADEIRLRSKERSREPAA